MSQTNIEYLFQMTSAGAAGARVASGRSNAQSSPFDEHFSRSSTAEPSSGGSAGLQESRGKETGVSGAASVDTQQRGGPTAPTGTTATHEQRDERAERGDDMAAPANETSDFSTERNSQSPDTVREPEDEGAVDDFHELPDESEAVAADVNVSTVDALLTEADRAVDAEVVEQLSDTASAASDIGDDADGNGSTTKRPRTAATSVAEVRQATEQPPAEEAGAASAPATGSGLSLEEATAGGEEPTEEPATRQLRGRQISPASDQGEGAPDSSIVEPGQEELTVGNQDEFAPRNSDESPRRGNSGNGVRTDPTASAQTAAVANVADKALPRAAETTATSASAEEAARPVSRSGAAKGDALAQMLGRSPAGRGTAGHGRQVERPDEIPRVDPARFVGRVAKAFQTAQDRGGTLQLRLNPPELGALRLELTVKEGVMSATLETESTAARRLLLDHLPALRDRLSEQNIRVERFDVDVRRDGAGQGDERAAQHQQHHHQPEQPPPRRAASHEAVPGETPPVDAARSQDRINNTQINLVA